MRFKLQNYNTKYQTPKHLQDKRKFNPMHLRIFKLANY